MANFIIGALVFGIIACAIYSIYKSKKNGKGCGSGCDGCGKGGCH